MELKKYNSRSGTITFKANSTSFSLGFQYQILTGEKEQVVRNAMKTNRSISCLLADSSEVSEYMKYNNRPSSILGTFSNDEIKREYERRFGIVKSEADFVCEICKAKSLETDLLPESKGEKKPDDELVDNLKTEPKTEDVKPLENETENQGSKIETPAIDADLDTKNKSVNKTKQTTKTTVKNEI